MLSETAEGGTFWGAAFLNTDFVAGCASPLLPQHKAVDRGEAACGLPIFVSCVSKSN
jgi:hypothetical protein